MGLPAGRLLHLGQTGSLRTAQQLDDVGLLAPRAGLPRGTGIGVGGLRAAADQPLARRARWLGGGVSPVWVSGGSQSGRVRLSFLMFLSAAGPPSGRLC